MTTSPLPLTTPLSPEEGATPLSRGGDRGELLADSLGWMDQPKNATSWMALGTVINGRIINPREVLDWEDGNSLHSE